MVGKVCALTAVAERLRNHSEGRVLVKRISRCAAPTGRYAGCVWCRGFSPVPLVFAEVRRVPEDGCVTLLCVGFVVV